MKIKTTAVCKQGGRDYNQDAYAVSISDDNACLVVCDGLGSYFGSEIASTSAANYISGEFASLAESQGVEAAADKNNLLTIVKGAHEYIHTLKESNSQIASSCTTLAVFCTVFDKSICAHIGDSRIYIFRNNRLLFQTVDHSLAQFAVELGKIKFADIRKHPDQNKLTRVLGSEYYTAPDINYLNEPLCVGDAIILCTDGFWEYVYENEMEHDLANSLSPESALEKMERRLLQRVGKYNDNYTAVIAYIVEG